MHCPLCHSNQLKAYFKSQKADYWVCLRCDLVFMDMRFYLDEAQEKQRYDTHQNNPDDANYRQFLSQVFNPVIKIIKPGSKGLDFGSGPGPTLSLMFEQQGHRVDLFDKFYANNQAIFSKKYDFITATEVLEHLRSPFDELNRLYDMLNNSGVLAVMTCMLNDSIDFELWYYKNDPTHICFFSKTTMQYLAKIWGANVQFYNNNVAIFFK